jgi:hypothetical protein
MFKINIQQIFEIKNSKVQQSEQVIVNITK